MRAGSPHGTGWRTSVSAAARFVYGITIVMWAPLSTFTGAPRVAGGSDRRQFSSTPAVPVRGQVRHPVPGQRSGQPIRSGSEVRSADPVPVRDQSPILDQRSGHPFRSQVKGQVPLVRSRVKGRVSGTVLVQRQDPPVRCRVRDKVLSVRPRVGSQAGRRHGLWAEHRGGGRLLQPRLHGQSGEYFT